MRTLLHDVEVEGRRVDITVAEGAVEAIERPGASVRAAEQVLDGGGGALLPGLWDHHVHLLATAAAHRSVGVGPGDVADADAFAEVLRRADGSLGPTVWLRAVGYHESVAGDLDRRHLDAIVASRPVRVQHRSGAAWILNTAACRAIGLEEDGPGGVERDAEGRITGRVFGADDWLRERLPSDPPPLDQVGDAANRLGIVGFTDATPSRDTLGWELLADARRSGTLRSRIVVTGAPELAATVPPAPLETGPVKVYLADHDLPGLDLVVGAIEVARTTGRAVAFHAVTRSALVLALAALRAARPGRGDRIEHGAVVPPELDPDLASLGLTVVTQPGFVAERGDDYLTDVDADDQPHLYRCASLLAAGIPVAASSDAPHATIDPWATIRAAAERRTPSGRILGDAERLPPVRALELFLGDPAAPGGPPRRVTVGAAADLCLLDRPLDAALAAPSADHVAATLVGGELVYRP